MIFGRLDLYQPLAPVGLLGEMPAVDLAYVTLVLPDEDEFEFELELELEPELELDFAALTVLSVEFAAADDLACGAPAVVAPSIRSAVTGPSVSSEAVAAYDESVATAEPEVSGVVLGDDVAAASAGGVVHELDASEALSVFIDVLGVVCA